MKVEDRLELYKSEYLFQIEMKEKIYTRMAIFSVFITGSITANFTMLDSLLKLSQTKLALVVGLWIFCLLYLLSIILHFYNISKSKIDKLVNSNVEMEQYRNTLRQHFISYTTTPLSDSQYQVEMDNYIDEKFKHYLVDQYAECASAYYLNNVDRQERLTKIAGSSYIILGLTLIVGLFYIFQKLEGKF